METRCVERMATRRRELSERQRISQAREKQKKDREKTWNRMKRTFLLEDFGLA